MPSTRNLLVNALLIGGLSAPILLAQAPPPAAVVFENVRIFNGTAGRLSGPSNVLIVGNVIKTISSTPIADPPGSRWVRLSFVQEVSHADE